MHAVLPPAQRANLTVEPLTLWGALIVAGDMREQDSACLRAITGMAPGEWFAIERFQSHGVALEVLQDGQPWAMTGLSLPNAWTGVLWMVARPGLRRETWRKLIRKARTVFSNVEDPKHPEYRHRVEAHVLEGWGEAARFAEGLGFVHEHTRKAGGSGGENIQVWTRLGPVKGLQ